jgi:NTP pyrophosphatase (non-canonical NTP hydrolase)
MSILKKAIETYGKDMQLNVAIEELSELIKEICKNKRGADNRDNILEELADCYVMMRQIEIIFGIQKDEIATEAVKKVNRLAIRLEERSENE